MDLFLVFSKAEKSAASPSASVSASPMVVLYLQKGHGKAREYAY